VPKPHHKSVWKLAIKALQKGGSQVFLDGHPIPRIEWDISGDCQTPTVVEQYGRIGAPLGRKYVQPLHEGKSVTVTLTTRCRKCETCTAKRAAAWRMRAYSEHAAAHRTWFGTLTFHPDVQARIINEARMYFHVNGLDYDTLPEAERWSRYLRFAGERTKLFYKRIRKTGARIRYLQVAEKHQSGLAHFHVLIHEVSPDHAAPWRVLKKSWPFGFVKFNLITEQDGRGAVTYPLKYLTKDAATGSVRASLKYGQPPIEQVTERLRVQRPPEGS
jgi:hypothetical protein